MVSLIYLKHVVSIRVLNIYSRWIKIIWKCRVGNNILNILWALNSGFFVEVYYHFPIKTRSTLNALSWDSRDLYEFYIYCSFPHPFHFFTPPAYKLGHKPQIFPYKCADLFVSRQALLGWRAMVNVTIPMPDARNKESMNRSPEAKWNRNLVCVDLWVLQQFFFLVFWKTKSQSVCVWKTNV